MAKRLSNREFCEKQLRVLLNARPGSRREPSPLIRLRAIWTLLALNEDLSDLALAGLTRSGRAFSSDAENSPQQPTNTPTIDAGIQRMLDAVDKLKGGDRGDKIPAGDTSSG